MFGIINQWIAEWDDNNLKNAREVQDMLLMNLWEQTQGEARKIVELYLRCQWSHFLR